MAFFRSNGIDIYYEVIGSGEPLLLLHGLFSSSLWFHENGYVDRLSSEYKLILIDLRGHGNSGKPHDSSYYHINDFTDDIANILAYEEVSTFHIIGFSLGGRIGYNLAYRERDRIRSLTILSSDPYSANFSSLKEYVESIPDSIINSTPRIEFSIKMIALFQAIDKDAILAIIPNANWPDISTKLSSFSFPVLIIYGGEESLEYRNAIQRSAKLIKNCKIVEVPNLVHRQIMSETNLVFPYISNFHESLK